MNHFNSFNELVAANTVNSPLQNSTLTDNMVGISYANPEVEAECTPENPKFGVVPENRRVLEKQLSRLEKAITLEELKGSKELYGFADKTGNFHSLTRERKGQLACALSGGWRLIFKPKHDPISVLASGELDWTKVTEVEIQEISEHYKKGEKE